jgi:hypothetical protein
MVPSPVPSPVPLHDFCLQGAPRAKAGICAEMWLLGLFFLAGLRTQAKVCAVFYCD